MDDGVLFDKRDARIVCESGSLLFRHAHRETFERPVVSETAGAVSTEVTRQS
jgi:hypothetical protein